MKSMSSQVKRRYSPRLLWISSGLIILSLFTEWLPAQRLLAASATATPASATQVAAKAKQKANLRNGPGTNYGIIGSVAAGQVLNLVARNAKGDWLQLATGEWIAAFLVSNAPTNVPIASGATTPAATNTPVAKQADPAQPAPTATPAATTGGTANVIIQSVFYDGAVYRVESDEYAVIANTGTAAINIGGWLLNAGDPGQNFTFPSFTLAAGQVCRVYTNEIHPESCGFSFGIGRAIWNNTDADCGYLYDASGQEVSNYCY
ncbi:MAG: lamin tail domain-containing protein [Chloroflexi bacterium]|nr:lamin tail domain-containing protein [Chloroflexota bacterium]